MPGLERQKQATTQSSDFLNSLRSICRTNFNIITGINFLLMTDYYLVFVTGTAYVQSRFSVSLSTAGLSSGLLVLGCLVGRFLSGNQISRLGAIRCLFSGILLFSAGIGWLFTVDSLAELFVQRFLTGMGLGIAGTATGTLVAHIVPANLHGLGIGLFSMSSALALALGPALGIALERSLGWQAIMGTNIFFCGSSLLAFCFLKRLTPIQLRHRPTFSIYSYIDPRVLRFSIIVFLTCMSYGCTQAFLSSFAAERNLNAAAGAFFPCYALVAMLTRPSAGRIFDLHGAKIIICPALLLTAAAIFLLAHAETPLSLLSAGLLLGMGFANFQSTGQAMALSLVSRSRFAQATSTFYIFFDLGIGLGPYIFGMLVPAFGYHGMFSSLAGIVLCAFCLYLITCNKKGRRRVR